MDFCRAANPRPVDLKTAFSPACEPHGMWHLDVNGQREAYRLNGRMRCNNGEVLQAAALDGLGPAILPTFMAAPHLRSGTLRVVLPDCALPGASLSVV
jgi:DNA-binding transcriptional LysR family regulator